MKYISEIETIDTSTGNTGIRIEISENEGDIVVRAVNSEEFTYLKTEADSFASEGIIRSKLKDEVDTVRVDAGTLETFHASDFLKINFQVLVGRIKAATTTPTANDWNYDDIEGAFNNYINFDPNEGTAHGWCLIVRPGGYLSDDKDTTIPVQINGYSSSGAISKHGFTDHTVYIKTVTWTQMDKTEITEECLVCPVNMGWSSTDAPHGDITFNYRGKTITRLWQFKSDSEVENPIIKSKSLGNEVKDEKKTKTKTKTKRKTKTKAKKSGE